MTRIYKTVGLSGLSYNDKRRLLEEQVTPLHERMVSDPTTDCDNRVIEPVQPEPTREETEEVQADVQKGLIPYGALVVRGPTGLIGPLVRRTDPRPWILVGVLGTLLVMTVGLLTWLINQPKPAPVVAFVTGTPQPPLPTYTLPVTQTPRPTYTPYPPIAPNPGVATGIPFSVSPMGSSGQITAIPAKASLPFSDNFETSLKSPWESLSGDWRSANGHLTTLTRGSWTYVVMDDIAWKNYTVDVDVALLHTDDTLGVVVRAQDGDNFMMYDLGYWDSRWGIKKGGNWIDLTKGNGVPVMSPNFPSHLKIEVRGDLFKAALENQGTLSINDNTFSSGKVGFGIWCGKRDSNCSFFDNFKITPLAD